MSDIWVRGSLVIKGKGGTMVPLGRNACVVNATRGFG